MRARYVDLITATILFLVAGCEESPTLPQTQPATLPADATEAPPTTEPSSALEWPEPPEAPPDAGPHGGQLFSLPGGRRYVEWQPEPGLVHLLSLESQPLRVTSIRAFTAGAEGPVDVPLALCEEDESNPASCYQYGPFDEDNSASLLLRLEIDNQGMVVKLIP